MMGVEAFPELAAMEAEFQASLVRGLLLPFSIHSTKHALEYYYT